MLRMPDATRYFPTQLVLGSGLTLLITKLEFYILSDTTILCFTVE